MGGVKIKSTCSGFSDSHPKFLFAWDRSQRQIQTLNFGDCVDFELFPSLRKLDPFMTLLIKNLTSPFDLSAVEIQTTFSVMQMTDA